MKLGISERFPPQLVLEPQCLQRLLQKPFLINDVFSFLFSFSLVLQWLLVVRWGLEAPLSSSSQRWNLTTMVCLHPYHLPVLQSLQSPCVLFVIALVLHPSLPLDHYPYPLLQLVTVHVEGFGVFELEESVELNLSEEYYQHQVATTEVLPTFHSLSLQNPSQLLLFVSILLYLLFP